MISQGLLKELLSLDRPVGTRGTTDNTLVYTKEIVQIAFILSYDGLPELVMVIPASGNR